MINILAKFFIKDYNDVESPKVRGAYGVLCGAVGIILNIILFTFKLIAGTISGSVAITADAFNNLSDAGSSIITMIGFKMAGHKPDPEHPFGHGRIEYITGLIVSFLIILMGFELGKSGIEKILNPNPVEFSKITVIILIFSILIKLYMYLYNKRTADKISSQAMMATASDSFSDSIATSAVLFSMMISEFTGADIDGYCGLLVAAFILYSGIMSAKDTISPLLGVKPEKDFIDKIEQYALSYPEIIGIHDLIVHDYGPGRVMISFHAEVPANGDILLLHDVVDNVEAKLKEALSCEAVIHMDPIVTDDKKTNEMKTAVSNLLKKVGDEITMHDFRMVEGPTHTNLIFDIVIPFDYKMKDDDVVEKLKEEVSKLPGNCFAVINVDKPYT